MSFSKIFYPGRNRMKNIKGIRLHISTGLPSRNLSNRSTDLKYPSVRNQNKSTTSIYW